MPFSAGRLGRILRGLLLIALLAAVGSCTKTTVAGVVLKFETDGTLDPDTLHVTITANARTPLDWCYPITNPATFFPTTLAIAPTGDPTETVSVTASVLRAGVTLDVRQNYLTEVPNDRVLELDILFSGKCSAQVSSVVGPPHGTNCPYGVAASLCPPGETCSSATGMCESNVVNATTLPDAGSPDSDSSGARSGGTVATSGSSPGLASGASAGSARIGTSGSSGSASPCGPIAAGNRETADGAGAACDVYCSTIMSNCTGTEAQYVSKADCMTACAFLPTNGPTGNTVACRANIAMMAGAEPSQYCWHAGPETFGSCGDDCAAYCDMLQGYCSPAAGYHGPEGGYASEAACLMDCDENFKRVENPTAPGFYSATGLVTGATLECLVSQLVTRAMLSCANQQVDCPNAPIALAGTDLGNPLCNGPPSVSGPSCAPGGPGMTNCGPGGIGAESCCTSLEVTGGMFYRAYGVDADGGAADLADPATVSAFSLDKYDVTVGRFRQFVNAVLLPDGGAGWLPSPGSGKHTHLNGGLGLVNSGTPGVYEPGWVTTDDGNIAPTNANLASCSQYSTWTLSAGSHENLPINCVNWYESYAFCIWDGGFLPSAAEWAYAASGGNQEREYPWGSTAPGTGEQYEVPHTNAPVGTATLGAGRWGQLDLVGAVFQWSLDWAADGYVVPCVDCANVMPPPPGNQTKYIWNGNGAVPGAAVAYGRNVVNDIGFRCARPP